MKNRVKPIVNGHIIRPIDDVMTRKNLKSSIAYENDKFRAIESNISLCSEMSNEAKLLKILLSSYDPVGDLGKTIGLYIKELTSRAIPVDKRLVDAYMILQGRNDRTNI